MGEKISLIIPDRTGLSQYKLVEPKKGSTEGFATELSKYVVGQEQAISAVAKALALADAGLNDPDRPIGIFFFTGPTGVGKTELARSIARVFCGGEDRLTIIDCAEYQQEHTVHNLVGAPPSYVGNNEKGKIPHEWLHKQDESGQIARSVILFDEVEKAHPNVQQLLLGMMDRATMMSRDGTNGMQPLDCRNTVLVFTSNAGSVEMQQAQAKKQMGFTRRDDGSCEASESDIREAAFIALRRACAPEFLGRIGGDRTIVFMPLKENEYPLVLEMLLENKNRQIVRRRESEGKPPYKLTATEEFARWVVGQIDKTYGARDLRNILETRVYPALAECLVGEEVDGEIRMDFDEDELRFFQVIERPFVAAPQSMAM